MPLFDDNKMPTRKVLERRLQEFQSLPNAGDVARRLREKRNISERNLAKAVGVMPSDIMRIEREGIVRLLVDPRLGKFGEFFKPGDSPQDNSKLEKFLDILKPNLHERAVLLQDISGEVETEILNLAIELIDDYDVHQVGEVDEVDKQSGFLDPWKTEPKPKHRERRRAAIPAVSALRAVGAPVLASNESGTVVAGSGTADGAGANTNESTLPGNLHLRIQVVVAEGNGQDTAIDIMTLNKRTDGPESVGLTLAESKRLLRNLQRVVVQRQATAYVTTKRILQRLRA